MSTIKQKFANHKNIVITSVIIALIAIACAFAVYLKLYTGEELWYEMFAAIIGVIITAVITMMLLVGQTDNEEKREKKGKVFEEKLRIYQEYLTTLYKVIKDGKNSNSEKLKLAFKTSSVAMHCEHDRVEKISESVEKIFKLSINDNGNALETLNEKGWNELLGELFKVMDEFKADLYQDFKGLKTSDWEKTLKNFTTAFAQDKGDSNAPQTLPDEKNYKVIYTDTKAVEEEWINKKNEWTGKGWNINDYLSDNNGFMLTLIGSDAGNNKPAHVNIGWYDGHYYIQASYWRDPNFAKALKAKYGGRRSYGTWWKHFENKFYNIPENKLYDNFCNDEGLRKYIYDWTEDLMDIVKREHNTIQLLDKVGLHDNWSIFTWEWDTLACEYNSEEFGRPYIDVKHDTKTEKIIIELSNRAEQTQLTEQLVQRMEGCGNLTHDEDGTYTLETIYEKDCDVSSKVKGWMKNIEKGTNK